MIGNPQILSLILTLDMMQDDAEFAKEAAKKRFMEDVKEAAAKKGE